MSRRAFEFFAEGRLKATRALDLCAGCGIVGLDFMAHCEAQQIQSPPWDFVEVQSLYEAHFNENARRFSATRFLNMNYSRLLLPEFRQSYDLIVCNPPYFDLGSGRLSPSEFKNRCRFFIDSDFATLVDAVLNSLSEGGTAWILVRDLEAHGLHRKEHAETLVGQRARVSWLNPIRGTPLLQLSKSV